MKRPLAAMLFCLSLPVAAISAGTRDVAQEAVPGVSGSQDTEGPAVAGMHDPATVFADPRSKAELLRYAKSLFLAQLGMAEAVAPPDPALKLQRSCFVTFFSGRRVIACFGGFHPRTPNVACEIMANIKLALLHDSRARSISRETAMSADVQITFPEEPCAVATHAVVNPSREGLLVENELKGVAIVPGEAKTAAWAFREAVKRLGEKDPSHLRVFKFRAYAVSSRKGEN